MAGQTYFISGGNRGIGFQLVKQLAANSANIVVATTRNIETSSQLTKLQNESENIKIVHLDVSSQESIDALEKELPHVIPQGIDVFIANAGIANGYFPILEVPREVYQNHYNTNVLGTIFLTKIIRPYLLKKTTRKIVVISSFAGRINDMSTAIPSPAYGSSKATLNFIAKSLSFELQNENFIVVPVHPGAVLTDMGRNAIETGPDRLREFFEASGLTPEYSAAALIKLIGTFTSESSGKFYAYDGSRLNF